MHCRVQALKALCEIRLEKDDIENETEDAIKPYKVTREQVLNSCFGCTSLSSPTLRHALQGASAEGAV